MPEGGFRYCFRERRAAVFALSQAAGVPARTAAAARRAGTSIGSRKDQRMHHIAFWCCPVDSDAVLLRARHGGRHEGGGRRQRKRDEKLVHLGSTFCKSRDGLRRLECGVISRATWKLPRKRETSLRRGTSGLRAYTYGTASFKIWERRPRPRHASSAPPLTPSPRDLHTRQCIPQEPSPKKNHEIIP